MPHAELLVLLEDICGHHSHATSLLVTMPLGYAPIVSKHPQRTMVSTTNILAAIGVVLLLPRAQVYRFVNFLGLYFLRPSSVHDNLHVPPAYALVIGAHDGIGKALAKELYDKGFHLILHGRNEAKMRAVADEIRARGTRNVLYFLADASDAGTTMRA